MTYRGRVHNGVIVIDGGITLPEGLIVTVDTTAAAASAGPTGPCTFEDLALPLGVPDLALNIDHYLYGHPKATDARQ